MEKIWLIHIYLLTLLTQNLTFRTMTQPTLEDVNRFLEEFRVTAKVFGLVYRSERKVNAETLFCLGITGDIREKIIFSLEGEDYVQGPIFDALNKLGYMWIFGKDYNDVELYIKLMITDRSLIISFHEARFPLKYPFK